MQLQLLYRQQFGSLVALTGRITRDFGRAEDYVQEAFLKAAERWQDEDVPEHAVAWLTTTARNAAIDATRRDQRAELFSADLAETDIEFDETELLALEPVEDDMLRLIFTCAHPALNIEARVALCLCVVCGLRTEEIARAFLVTDATMSQRLWRAKNKIRQAGIAYRSPAPEELEERLSSVTAVVYLIFNEGWLARSGAAGLRMSLVDEAIRLGRILTALLPNALEARALLGLMLLQNARRDARFDDRGAIVLLPDQNRSLWYRDEINEGLGLVRSVFEQRGGHGRYALMAAIAAVHAQASRPQNTDWDEIVILYEYLMAIDSSPVVALNHAVAVGEARSARAGLQLLDSLAEFKAMQRYHLYHAARAEMLQRENDSAGALEAIERALDCCPAGVERELLCARQSKLKLR